MQQVRKSFSEQCHMTPHGLTRRDCIALENRLRDSRMLRNRSGHSSWLERCGSPIRRCLEYQTVKFILQDAIMARYSDGIMELEIGFVEPIGISRIGGTLTILVSFQEALALIGRDASGRLDCRKCFEFSRDAERVKKICDCKLDHLKTLTSSGFDKTDRRKPLERLSDRRSRDTIVLGKLTLVQPISWLANAVNDLLLEAPDDLAREG
jgi:hypothetical protein